MNEFLDNYKTAAEDILHAEHTDTTKLAQMTLAFGQLYQIAIKREAELRRMIGGDDMCVSIVITPQELKDRAAAVLKEEVTE